MRIPDDLCQASLDVIAGEPDLEAEHVKHDHRDREHKVERAERAPREIGDDSDRQEGSDG